MFGLSQTWGPSVPSLSANTDATRSQEFTYDQLNRLQKAVTVNSSGANCWGEQYGYDPWGNLLTITLPSDRSSCALPDNLSISVNSQNQFTGYTYDAAGNLISIPGAGGGTFTYNAENQMLTAGGVTYTYDGDGNRVEKSSGTLYWYGTASDPLEVTTLSGSLTNDYIFFGGKRIARRDASGNIFPYFVDRLGSSRKIEKVAAGSSTASLCYDADFYPFGRENTFTDSCSPSYKFTGKQRDTESGLDYFGARHYASSLGRFMSPDSPFADQSASDPQSWNLYGYVRNNPLGAFDPTGNACVSTDGGKSFHDDDSGGQTCAKSYSKSENNTASAVVSAKPSSAPVAFLTNLFITLDNTANDYFAPLLGGYRPSYMQNLPNGSGFAANLGTATAIVGTALIGPEDEAQSGIIITEDALDHIAERHIVGGARAVAGKKSIWNVGEDVRALIDAARGVRPTKMTGGDLARVVDAGRPIGIDRATGATTSTYTVITKPDGELVNAFPGKP